MKRFLMFFNIQITYFIVLFQEVFFSIHSSQLSSMKRLSLQPKSSVFQLNLATKKIFKKSFF